MHPLIHTLIGNKRKKESALIKEQIKLATSITCLPVGFVIIDPAEKILTINPAAQLILGSLIVPTMLEQFPEGLREKLRLHVQTTASTQRVIAEDDVLFGEKHLKLYCAPILAHAFNSDYLGTVVVLEDVTEARVLERSRDEFFSIASHELRTPLTAIRGTTSMIIDMYKDQLTDPDLRSMLDDIYQSSIRLIGIVNDFLNMSRIEQGKIEYKIETFDLLELCKEVLTELEGVKTNPAVKFQLVLPQTALPPVFADRNKTKEILINLIGNALKFTQAGAVTLSCLAADNTLTLYCTDTGSGISPENQHILFHKFQQASDSLIRRDSTKSTGLGLYISKLIIEGMRGTIWLESSKVGVGSTFAIRLPTG